MHSSTCAASHVVVWHCRHLCAPDPCKQTGTSIDYTDRSVYSQAQMTGGYTKKERLRPTQLILPGVLAVAVSYGLARYTYGLFVPNIREELGLSTEVLGFIASGSYAGFLMASAVTAAMAARTGPRLPVVIGSLCAAAGMLLISFSDNLVFLAAGVILAGTSPGFAYAPFSDAVVRLIPENERARTYAIINSGTGFGVMFAGPVAVWAGESWRSGWLVFAALALCAAVWNLRILPSGAHMKPGSEGTGAAAALPDLRWRWFMGPKSARLFAAALLVGVATSAYWTFAVDLIVTVGPGGDIAHATAGPIFWTVVGASGVVGAFAGDAVTRLGLKKAFVGTVIPLAASTALLAAMPTSWLAVLSSAVLFGAAFIAVTAVLGLWSINVFHDRPSAGFGATFFLLSAGQLIGPSAFALISGWLGLAAAFHVAAALMGTAILLRPRGAS